VKPKPEALADFGHPYHSSNGKAGGGAEVTIELPLAALVLDPDTADSDDPPH
jgi:hypothetical protein